MIFLAVTLYSSADFGPVGVTCILVVAQEFALALQPVYPVLFEQPGNTPGQFLHDPVFPGYHFIDIQFHTGDVDAVPGRLLFDEGVMMRGIQQRLGRYATCIQTGPAQVGFAVAA